MKPTGTETCGMEPARPRGPQRRAVAAGDRVQAQVTGVDVAAGERAGEPGREVRRPGYRAGALRGSQRCVHEDPFHRWHSLTIARRAAHRARHLPWLVPWPINLACGIGRTTISSLPTDRELPQSAAAALGS